MLFVALLAAHKHRHALDKQGCCAEAPSGLSIVGLYVPNSPHLSRSQPTQCTTHSGRGCSRQYNKCACVFGNRFPTWQAQMGRSTATQSQVTRARHVPHKSIVPHRFPGRHSKPNRQSTRYGMLEQRRQTAIALASQASFARHGSYPHTRQQYCSTDLIRQVQRPQPRMQHTNAVCGFAPPIVLHARLPALLGLLFA